MRLPVRDGGPPDGEPVVLLHGFPQDGSAFDDVVPHLHAAGLRTLVPDQRGYAPHARPWGRWAYRTAELVADVEALLDDRGVAAAHVVGHDWGGAVAWALGAWLPERTRSLTVLSTPHPAAMVAALPGGQALASWYMAAFQLPVLPELALPLVLPRLLRSSGLPPAVAEGYARRLGSFGARRAALDWYRAIPFSRRPIGPVDVPTTYVWGARDPALRRRAADLTARQVRGAYRFVELEAGHWLPETRPDDVADAVLRRVRDAR